MTAHASKDLTDAQRHMLAMSTRGAAKQSPSQRSQIIKPRSPEQRFQRPDVACITCGQPRKPWAHPVCSRCVEAAA